MEYAFVGSTVNLAARVQALRTHQVDILVTEALRAGVKAGLGMPRIGYGGTGP
jgi:class 3 adenylate cyclase